MPTKKQTNGGKPTAKTKTGANGQHTRRVPTAAKKKRRAPSRSARKLANKRRARARKTAYGALSLVFVCASVAIVLFCAARTQAYFQFIDMRSYLDTDAFYPGMSVDGVDLGGVSLSDALAYFQEKEQTLAGDRSVAFSIDGKTRVYGPAELGYGSNYEAVVRGAWNLGRSGEIARRYAEAVRGCEYTVNRGWSEESLRRLTDAIAAGATVAPADARILRFIPNEGRFEFSDEQVGYTVDPQALYESAFSAVESGTTVEVDRVRVDPQVTKADLESQYGEITVAVTNASSSTSNRLTNIKLSCASINGTCLQPGDSFSFNEVVGERTKSAGYKKAGVYISGELGEEIGGGICQVATTLFNAVVKANLDITERHAHSRTVAYVDKGKDATVSWGLQDLKFVNSLDEPVYIVAYVNKDARVKIHVFGRLRADGVTISLVPILQETIPPKDDTYRYTTDLPTGAQRVASEARKGYRVNTYKAYTDADGNVIDKEFLCSSTYPSAGAVIEVGS